MWAHVNLGGDLGENAAFVEDIRTSPGAAERTPGQEGDLVGDAVVEFATARPVSRRELVLHRDEPTAEDMVRERDLGDRGVGDARHVNHSLVEQFAQCPDGLLVGHAGVGAMKLVEADRLDTEACAGLSRRPLEVGWRAVAIPGATVAKEQPALGGDENLFGATTKSLGDQEFVVALAVGLRRIGIGSVDEGDAGVESGMDGRDCPVTVRSSGQREWHRAEADGADFHVADPAVFHALSLRRAPKSERTRRFFALFVKSV